MQKFGHLSRRVTNFCTVLIDLKGLNPSQVSTRNVVNRSQTSLKNIHEPEYKDQLAIRKCFDAVISGE